MELRCYGQEVPLYSSLINDIGRLWSEPQIERADNSQFAAISYPSRDSVYMMHAVVLLYAG